MVGIYKFTNIHNGMAYIGQSTNIKRRYNQHKNVDHESTIFHDAIREYGFDSFTFEIIEVCERSELNSKEVFYIKKYNTLYPNGYNKSPGGQIGNPTKLSSIKAVTEIMDLLRNTKMTNIEIGELYCVSDQTISDINNGKIWYNDKVSYPIRKPVRIEKQYCKKCGSELYSYNISGICCKCLHSFKQQPPISKHELEKLLFDHSFVYVGKLFNVTDNAVRKWCDKYGLPRHSKYYKCSYV